MQTGLAGEARRRREEALDDPWRLDAKTATEEAFNDEYATGRDVPAHERGPHSRWAQGLLDTKCCGWRERPTAAETYGAHGNQAEPVHGSRQGDGRAPVARLTLAEPARTLWRQVRDTIRTALTDPRTNDRCYELGGGSGRVEPAYWHAGTVGVFASWRLTTGIGGAPLPVAEPGREVVFSRSDPTGRRPRCRCSATARPPGDRNSRIRFHPDFRPGGR